MFIPRSLGGVVSAQCSFHRLHMSVIAMLPGATNIRALDFRWALYMDLCKCPKPAKYSLV